MESNKKKEIWRVVKFTLFSASAGIIEIVSFALLNELLHLPYWLSYLTALVLSVLWNFTLNRKFTFQSAANVPVAMFKVACYYLVFTPLSTLLEHWLTGLGWNEYLVTAINMILNFVTEFLYQRFFVYKDSIDTAKEGIKAKSGPATHGVAGPLFGFGGGDGSGLLFLFAVAAVAFRGLGQLFALDLGQDHPAVDTQEEAEAHQAQHQQQLAAELQQRRMGLALDLFLLGAYQLLDQGLFLRRDFFHDANTSSIVPRITFRRESW